MRKLIHVGIPTKVKPENASYVDVFGVYVSNPDESKHMIEWLYFEKDSPMAKIIQEETHFAYQVDDLESELKDAKIVWPLTDMGEMKIAFIVEEGVPVELVQIG